MAPIHIGRVSDEVVWIRNFSISELEDAWYHFPQTHSGWTLWISSSETTWKGFVLSVEMTSLSHMKQSMKEPIDSIITQSLEEVWKIRIPELTMPERCTVDMLKTQHMNRTSRVVLLQCVMKLSNDEECSSLLSFRALKDFVHILY